MAGSARRWRHVRFAGPALGILVLFAGISASDPSRRGDERTLAAIQSSLPERWSLAESKEDQVPYGHHWGQSYDGPTGWLHVFAGPADRELNWRDDNGIWHREAIAKEALRIWIMPPEYEQSWRRFLKLKRPVPASHVYSGDMSRVFGQEGVHVSRARFEKILGKAVATNWLDSAEPNRGLSWSTWKEDLRRQLAVRD